MRTVRDLKENSEKGSEIWLLCKKIKRLIRDAIRLKYNFQQGGIDKEKYSARFQKLKARLSELADGGYENAECKRLSKRLHKHQDHIFTFLERLEIKHHNNDAERAIRPNVLIRKVSAWNRSPNGAKAHKVIMSVLQTYRQNGVDFFEFTMEVIKRSLVSRGELYDMSNLLISRN